MHTDPSIDSKDFYLSVDHRKANLYFSGLTPKSQIFVTKVIVNSDHLNNFKGHIHTWQDLNTARDHIVSSQGTYRFGDSCGTDYCEGKLEIEFTYNDKKYVFTLVIDTISS